MKYKHMQYDETYHLKHHFILLNDFPVRAKLDV